METFKIMEIRLAMNIFQKREIKSLIYKENKNSQ